MRRRELDGEGPPCVILEDFLLPDELAELLQHTLDSAKLFQKAQVAARPTKRGAIRDNYRRTLVLSDVGEIGDAVRHRVRSYLPWVLQKLRLPSFQVARVEAQITAGNHGAFFRKHIDSGGFRRRVVSYVYYFYRRPRRFSGGELLIYPTWHRGKKVQFASNFRTVQPRRNRIVFFPSGAVHEVRNVSCPSRDPADSRFTVNGWVLR
jgi:SM-20-related protein